MRENALKVKMTVESGTIDEELFSANEPVGGEKDVSIDDVARVVRLIDSAKDHLQ